MRTTWQRVGVIPGLPVSPRQRARNPSPALPPSGGGFALDASPQPMGGAELTQRYLAGMSGTPKRPGSR